MALPTKTETMNVTFNQVAEMYRTQLAIKQKLNNGIYAQTQIEASLQSTQASIIGLLFQRSTIVGAASGIISLAQAVNALNAGSGATLADAGHDALINLYFIMNERGYVRANITVTRVYKTKNDDFGIIRSVKTNSLTKANGVTVTQ